MQNGVVDLASLTPDKPTTRWLLHMGWLQMGRGGGSSHHPSSPTDTAPYPSSRDGWRFVGSTQSEKTLNEYSRDGCKFVGCGPEQANFVSILQRRVADLLALPREPRDFALENNLALLSQLPFFIKSIVHSKYLDSPSYTDSIITHDFV
jgi:hypothetical protein